MDFFFILPTLTSCNFGTNGSSGMQCTSFWRSSLCQFKSKSSKAWQHFYHLPCPFEKGHFTPINQVCAFCFFKHCTVTQNECYTGIKISERLFLQHIAHFLFSMAWGWGPPWRSFLNSTASALTLRSVLEAQNASHDPGGGVDTWFLVLEVAAQREKLIEFFS